jgi:putative transposase
VFAQPLNLVSRHEFEALANQHHTERKLHKMTRWSQFVAMATAQLSNRSSLRDVVSNLTAQASKLYHLGAAIVSRSSLARINEQQPYTLYEQLAGKLLAQCQARAPRHGFRFKNKLYSLDTSTIDLCLCVSVPHDQGRGKTPCRPRPRGNAAQLPDDHRRQNP